MTTLEYLELCLRNGHGASLDTGDVEWVVGKLRAAEELARAALKAHKELEAGYETCGLIVDMKHLALVYRAAGREDV
jgi:hypothetical protein